ncbi:MAG: triose-phosphate isomerase [Polyangiaceae bacterium]|nr:triose-phosphate isomerase [Polyangiaceae bacterium]MCW5788894.1 triose-phosphate isomerase [Polyangiaceae bacterium]
MTKRVPLIAGNWKLNHGGPSSCALALDVVRGLAAGAFPRGSVEVVLAPPFTALAAVSATLEEEAASLSVPVEVAAQNLYPVDEGAFTGEVSAPMLLDAGCKWVIIGHSERRQLFGETDEGVEAKVSAALRAGLRPIACVGETWEERSAGSTLEVIRRQVSAFAAALAAQPGVGVIAYEPVWAIGTGQVAGPDEAQAVHAAIRAQLAEINQQFADVTRLLYGGSVKPDNARGLLACPDIDGALVGGASLKASAFVGIAAATLPEG